MLVATITKSGDVAAVQQVIGLVGETTRPTWQRMAVLRGLDTALPARAGGRGRGLPGVSFEGDFPTTPGRGVTLPAAPDVLTRLASGTGELAEAAREVADRLDWPGRPAPVVVAAPLTPEQEKLRAAGATIYNGICIGCHTPEGGARENLGAALNGSALVNNNDPTAVIRILLGGKEGKVGLMPPLAATMTDEQAASVLTYIRRSWGNTAPAVDPLNVMEIRGLTRTRTKPWTDEELQPPAGRGGRGGGGAGGGGRRGGGAGPAGGN
jgi:mono/diheme cytochrome c family protein